MTGRGAGFCAGYQMPGYANAYLGRGWFGRGRGWYGRGGGRGWRHRYYATGVPGWAWFDNMAPGGGPYAYPVPYAGDMTPKAETEMLREHSAALQRELKEIEERISTLEKVQTQEKK